MPGFKTYYQNFALDNSTVSLTVIIWAICIGLAVGVIAYTFSRHRSSKIVSKLSEGGYSSKENTATAATLGIKASPLLRASLADFKPLRKYVTIVNPDECRIERKKTLLSSVRRVFRRDEPSAVYDLEKAQLYMTEDAARVAKMRYGTKGNPYVVAVIAAVLFLLCAVGLTVCMPKLLELVDSMITAYKNL
ncbi:MAG: hypothetical protein IKL24_02690 [Clostridia bacterium]|nr:hypothetical protein [Clostridia bacterium]